MARLQVYIGGNGNISDSSYMCYAITYVLLCYFYIKDFFLFVFCLSSASGGFDKVVCRE